MYFNTAGTAKINNKRVTPSEINFVIIICVHAGEMAVNITR